MRLLATALLAAICFAQDYLVEGNPKSAVRVIAYEDLQCPDCAAYRNMLDQRLLPKYGNKVAFEHRDFPLPKHKWARPAAIASRYFEHSNPAIAIAFRKWAFTSQKDLTPENFNEKLAAWAQANGSDAKAVLAALADPKLNKLVEADYQEGIARGVARTPTVFVNGEPFIETFTFEAISKSIDSAIQAASGSPASK